MGFEFNPDRKRLLHDRLTDIAAELDEAMKYAVGIDLSGKDESVPLQRIRSLARLELALEIIKEERLLGLLIEG